jgi:hypothetical protein
VTLVSLMVTDGLRESNLIALGEDADPAQGAEGLRLLDRLVSSVFGNEVGERLQDWTFPPVNGAIYPWQYIPPDTRIVMGANAGGRSFNINPYPQNGDRLQLVDAGANFATNNVTLIPGPAKFGGSSSNYVANTNGFNKTWIYRADIADWALISPLEASGEFPFPQAYDDAFIGLLAARLSPRYEKAMSAESQASLQRAMTQLRAGYARTRLEPADLAVLRLRGAENCYPYLGEGHLYGY